MTLLPLLLGLLLLPEPSVRITDLYRFPGPKATEDVLAFQKKHIRWLEARYSWDVLHADELLEWHAEAEWRRQVWQQLYYANHRGPFPLLNLKEILDAIGVKDYQDGIMPCPVPLHYFGSLEAIEGKP